MSLNNSESDKHEKGENIFFYLSEIFQEFSKKLNSIIFPMVELSWEAYKKFFTDINSILNSYPTYNDYIQLVEEFSQGNETSNLYNKVIKVHFQAKED